MIQLTKNTWSQQEYIDLRSDTTTQPTDSMREAMYSATVGDDTLGDDPTVKELEALAADMCGMEAALLCPSGMMANTLAMRMLTGFGDKVFCIRQHMYGSGVFAATSLTPVFLPVSKGHLVWDEVEQTVDSSASLLCYENTYNGGGGVAVTPEETRRLRQLADDAGIGLYLDGARIFNAAVALDCPADQLVSPATMAMFCLSKGLSAPIGSLLLGPEDLIDEARSMRHMLGGSMRQAGIIAAAGIVALNEQIDQLQRDHANAKKLARGLAELPTVELEIPAEEVDTNIIFFRARPPWTNQQIVDALAEENILALVLGERIRAVTHRHIDSDDIAAVLDVLRGLNRPAHSQPAQGRSS